MSKERPFTLHAPDLPAGKTLWVKRVVGREGLSRLFEYVVDLVCEDPALDFDLVVGHEMVIGLELHEGTSERYLHGYVTDVSFVAGDAEYFLYRAVVRPHLWRLTQRTNSRIFQKKTVAEIVKTILDEHGITDVEAHLGGDSRHGYLPWDYCVQYQETDFAFVSRLLELEGIHYFFRGAKDRHTLVLSDSNEGHEAQPGYETIDYLRVSAQGETAERVWSWRTARTVLPGRFVGVDYDFEKPAAQLSRESTSTIKRTHPKAKDPEYDVFAFPEPVVQQAGYSADTLQDYARLRAEEQHVRYETMTAETNVRGLVCGATFALSAGARPDTDGRTFLITSYEISGEQSFRRTGSSAARAKGGTLDAPIFRARLGCIDAKNVFRPVRATPKPRVYGPQTAVVVGKAGEEIWTDKYGRVKVQFHWDREGKKDEESSCWVRVSQAWAGSQFGSIHIPRLGQEVVVEFLDGDPDRPLVTGRVYNAFNMPPYDLPANQTQSGIKSRSTKGGGQSNANEIRFEDKKGSEELFVQAEKDHNVTVKHAQSVHVGASRSLSVGGNETHTTKGTRTTTIVKAETQTFVDTRVATVALTDDLTIAGAHTGTYHHGRTLTVDGAADTLTVDGQNKVVTVHGEYNTTADTQFKVTQKGDSLLIKDSATLTSAGAITLTNGTCKLKMENGKISVTADTQIELSCGKASVTLKQDGTIEITGQTKVSLSGGQGSIELAAAGATMSGPKVTVSGASATEITGAVVKIN